MTTIFCLLIGHSMYYLYTKFEPIPLMLEICQTTMNNSPWSCAIFCQNMLSLIVILSPPTGTFLYGDYTSTTVLSSTVTSTIIGDTYCAVSFNYSAPPTVELVLIVEGLGSIWSSLLVTKQGWNSELIAVDLDSVSLLNTRQMMFTAGHSDRPNGDPSVPLYAALDDLTLHPCIDCSVPGIIHPIICTMY